MKQKCKLLFLLSLMLLTSCTDTREKVSYSYTIINKEIRSELDNLSTWFWGHPMSEQVYYFSLENYVDKKVTSEDYNKYNIGDVYTWDEYK